MASKGVLRKTDPELIALIRSLKETGRTEDSPIWRDIATRLERPSRLWAEVNIGKLDKVVRDGETAVVPGKLLATGEVSKAVNVAAFKFSDKARKKITDAGGSCISIKELAGSNAGGAKCRIIG